MLMKYSICIMLFMLCCIPFANAANNDDGYMEGHPAYNDNYYNPSYNQSPSSPNYRSDDQNKAYSNNKNDYNDAPHGNDIRDYNPYYDRYGNLKQ